MYITSNKYPNTHSYTSAKRVWCDEEQQRSREQAVHWRIDVRADCHPHVQESEEAYTQASFQGRRVNLPKRGKLPRQPGGKNMTAKQKKRKTLYHLAKRLPVLQHPQKMPGIQQMKPVLRLRKWPRPGDDQKSQKRNAGGRRPRPRCHLHRRYPSQSKR